MEDRRALDEWSMTTRDEEAFVHEVDAMEKHSSWISDVVSSELRLEPLEAPLFASQAAALYGFDPELALETCETGTKLMLDVGGTKKLVRDTARSTLSETAKLYGSALGRMSVPLMAATLNNGLSVARGSSLILDRYGKVSAVHAGGDAGYLCMPISALLDQGLWATQDVFGDMDFVSGSISHGYVTALYDLTAAQKDITALYEQALNGAVSRFFQNPIPALRFISSDTASSCARMIPVFRIAGSECAFSDGVCVRHSKRTGSGPLQGVDAFAEDCKGLYAMFRASADEIHRLARLEIQHPENCVILLCKKLAIPRKYGESARVMAERFKATGKPLSAHDVYLCMTAAVTEARTSASMTTILNLQEQIAKVPFCDWASYDVGGAITWN